MIRDLALVTGHRLYARKIPRPALDAPKIRHAPVRGVILRVFRMHSLSATVTLWQLIDYATINISFGHALRIRRAMQAEKMIRLGTDRAPCDVGAPRSWVA
jgi:hypothetical protein